MNRSRVDAKYTGRFPQNFATITLIKPETAESMSGAAVKAPIAV
jgi:hypothetical protein